MVKLLKILFPLSFPTGKVWKSVLIYLSLYIGGGLFKGTLIYFWELNFIGGISHTVIAAYVFFGLFLLCLDYLNIINKNKLE
jgi:hypothetical protein